MIWVVAVAVGLIVAWWEYGRVSGAGWIPAGLRALAAALLVALVFNAPTGSAVTRRPFAALDVSASWQRGHDLSGYQKAVERLQAAQADSVFFFGDSMRSGAAPSEPRDDRTLVRSVVDHALAAGRPLTLITDGEIDDPEALATLPAGSDVDLVSHPVQRDAALTTLDAPRAAVAGDTITVRITVAAGSGGANAGTLAVSLEDARVTVQVPALAPYGEVSLSAQLPVRGSEGFHVLQAVVTTPGDVEARNDTLAVPMAISPAAGAVFVSTSPDEDARYALSVLRGAVALPTRAFYRVTPGNWRVEGALTPVSESDVLQALASAPLVVFHGDSSALGSPRALTRGSLALIVPPRLPPSPDEWYATEAPPSPVAMALADVPWDSLPPIEVTEAPLHGDWVGLVAKRGRRYDARPIVVGFESGHRRFAIVGAGGLWLWRFRGGASADAYAALWGSLFDWLATEHTQVSSLALVDALVREGDPIRWRRGAKGDSIMRVVLVPRATGHRDTVVLHFGTSGRPEGHPYDATSPSLAAGTYDVEIPGGHTVLVVNRSREWVPRRPTVAGGHVGGATLADAAPRLRSMGAIYIALVMLLCAEWLARRRLGLR